jgi:hypothetical protein
MIEWFFLTLNGRPCGPRQFESRDLALRIVVDWLAGYDTDRPHSSVGLSRRRSAGSN